MIDTVSTNNKENSVLENKNILDKFSADANAPRKGDTEYTQGATSYMQSSSGNVATAGPETAIHQGTSMGVQEKFKYVGEDVGAWRGLNADEKANIGNIDMGVDGTILTMRMDNILQNAAKRRELLGNNFLDHQNASNFPALSKAGSESTLLAAKYDYKIIPGDTRYKKAASLEKKLIAARANLGIPVHGNNNIARAQKYYMYNRFKTPDLNLAFNKMTTHIFFTRPDLNLLTYAGHGGVSTINDQARGHTDTEMLWLLNPSLFKLLTNSGRCGDSDNFNLLLSQQVSSFDIKDETIATDDVGKSWNEHNIAYGSGFTGKQAGEFTCSFVETQDLSVINLIRLWLIYIDNVSNGAWSPSYNLYGTGINKNNSRGSHVYMKALDYACSAYVFKCGPDGEDVLYWTKYYGVFPTNTGVNSLSWEAGTPTGESPKPSITFRYSFKKDMSPISLIEFNANSGLTGGIKNEGMTEIVSENSFNPNLAMSDRPYVGAPYIEFSIGDKNGKYGLVNNGVNYAAPSSHIRLKFKKTSDPRLTDELLYKATF